MIIDVEIRGEQTIRYESDIIPRHGEILILTINRKEQQLRVISVSHLITETLFSIDKIKQTQVCINTIPILTINKEERKMRRNELPEMRSTFAMGRRWRFQTAPNGAHS